MNDVIFKFNNNNYITKYNEQTGYYEAEIMAESGGVFNVDVTFTDLLLESHIENKKIQIWAKEKTKLEQNKFFMWVFDGNDFNVIDIIEITNYQINIDEETNANSIVRVLKKTKVKANDIVCIKKNEENIYWGIIDNVQNENGKNLYEFTLKYITNIFNQDIELKEERLIREKGIEDFIKTTIDNNFIKNEDNFLNKSYLEIVVETHNKIEKSVDNVENGIYNLHTWLTNCTQSYDILYKISIVDNKLRITIKREELKKQLIDVNAQAISDYTEVFETTIVSKVKVLTKEEGSYTLYLKNDRTTTENMLDNNRAQGETKIVYTEKLEDARQTALDIIRQNIYKHMVTFNLYNTYIEIGTPIAIKTKESVILNTYISGVKITENKFVEYTCGNIRIKFIDKILKERKI